MHLDLPFSAIPAPVWLIWLAFIFLILIIAAWHYAEDKKYAARAHDTLSHALLRLARNRSIQLIILTVFFTIAWIARDLRDAAQHTPPLLPEIFGAHALPTTPPQTAADVEDEMDIIKERYEEAFVNYYFLRKCERAAPEDYYAIQSALMQNLAALKAPPEWAERVIQAALGSYEGVYIYTACDPKIIDSIESRFKPYISSLRAENPKK